MGSEMAELWPFPLGLGSCVVPLRIAQLNNFGFKNFPKNCIQGVQMANFVLVMTPIVDHDEVDHI